jgi:hypothetical protein
MEQQKYWSRGSRCSRQQKNENSIHETEKNFGPFRSFQLQAESGGCVVLLGHLAAMMGTLGRPGSVEVGYPPWTPAQARVCMAPGDVPAPCPRSPRGYWSMVRVAIGSACTQAFNEEVARAASQIVPCGRQDEDAGHGGHQRVFSPPGLVDCWAVWLQARTGCVRVQNPARKSFLTA